MKIQIFIFFKNSVTKFLKLLPMDLNNFLSDNDSNTISYGLPSIVRNTKYFWIIVNYA